VRLAKDLVPSFITGSSRYFFPHLVNYVKIVALPIALCHWDICLSFKNAAFHVCTKWLLVCRCVIFHVVIWKSVLQKLTFVFTYGEKKRKESYILSMKLKLIEVGG
jgi:hypothetical protein